MSDVRVLVFLVFSSIALANSSGEGNCTIGCEDGTDSDVDYCSTETSDCSVPEDADNGSLSDINLGELSNTDELTIDQNESLNPKILINLDQVNPDVVVENNDGLLQIDLGQMSNAGGSLELHDNQNLETIEMGSFSGNEEEIGVLSNTNLETIDLNALSSVEGVYVIHSPPPAPTNVMGWVCGTSFAPCIPYCGDSVVNPGEQCDDGNQTNGDGCSNRCEIENE